MHLTCNLMPFHYLPLFVQTTRAAIAPGTHPHKVNSATINIVPHPLSNTANGGKRIHSNALPRPMLSAPVCEIEVIILAECSLFMNFSSTGYWAMKSLFDTEQLHFKCKCGKARDRAHDTLVTIGYI